MNAQIERKISCTYLFFLGNKTCYENIINRIGLHKVSSIVTINKAKPVFCGVPVGIRHYQYFRIFWRSPFYSPPPQVPLISDADSAGSSKPVAVGNHNVLISNRKLCNHPFSLQCVIKVPFILETDTRGGKRRRKRKKRRNDEPSRVWFYRRPL